MVPMDSEVLRKKSPADLAAEPDQAVLQHKTLQVHVPK